MEVYRSETVLQFGKFKGKTVLDILMVDMTPNLEVNGKSYNFANTATGYIEWCIKNIDSFCIHPDDIDLLRAINPGFLCLEEEMELNLSKFTKATNNY